MKLSEAIRAGARLRPQAYGALVGIDAGVPATCALGAAAEALGLVRLVREGSQVRIEWHGTAGDGRDLPRRFPLLTELAPDPLPCGCLRVGKDVEAAITHLNDAHRWSRESIASWVAWIERK